MVVSMQQRAQLCEPVLCAFTCVVPKARAPPPKLVCERPDATMVRQVAEASSVALRFWQQQGGVLHVPMVRQQLFFPDRRLIQYDCGKLQVCGGVMCGV